MNKKQWLVAFVLADFLALNAWVVWHYGYAGFLREALSSLAGIAVFVDLCIALTLIAVWMWNDARARGIAVVPYLAAGLFFGSVGPLAYLLRALGRPAPAHTAPPLPAVAR